MNFLIRPGFLGTHASLLADLSLVLILTSSILFTIGWQLAVHKHYKAHKWIQTCAAFVNATVVISFMINSFIVHILPGLPSKLFQGDYAVTTIHALIGAAGLLLGLYNVIQAHKLVPEKLRFRRFKLMMRISYSLYMLATVGGVTVYLLVYVFGI